jgi:transcriptional regulator with XRE-family HTH domain
MKMPSSSAVGHAIRALRERRGLAASRVSLTAKISPAELLALEAGRGRTTIAVLDRVARSLGSSLVAIVRDAELGPPPTGSPLAGRAPGLPEIARAIAELPRSVGSKVDAAGAAAVLHAMAVSGQNQSAAARLLGMERKAFVRRLARAKRKKR